MMRRSRFLLLYAAGWIPIAALFAMGVGGNIGEPVPATILLIAGIEVALPGALLGLGIWPLARQLDGRGWPAPRLLATHALLALAYTTLWLCGIIAVLAAHSPQQIPGFIRSSLGWQIVMGGLFYSVQAGIAHAILVQRRYHKAREAAAHAEALRVRAELQAIRARLDPHFLFNTLHSIMTLVRRDSSTGERALERLGDLLRHLLELDRRQIDELPLADELDFVHDFLALEKLRLGDRLQVGDDVDPDALDCLVPALLLQPLVENAIRHAIAPRPEGGTIRIAARADDHTLCIEIEDDGPGLPPAPPEAGLGLALVRQRLQTHFSGLAHFEIATAPHGGTRARIRLPARTTAGPRTQPITMEATP